MVCVGAGASPAPTQTCGGERDTCLAGWDKSYRLFGSTTRSVVGQVRVPAPTQTRLVQFAGFAIESGLAAIGLVIVIGFAAATGIIACSYGVPAHIM